MDPFKDPPTNLAALAFAPALITKSLNLVTLDKIMSDLPGNGFAILLDTIANFFSSAMFNKYKTY